MGNFQTQRAARVGGFTLIELLVVLAILTMLAGLVGPKVMEIFSNSKPRAALLQIKNFESALDIYKLDVGRYPSTAEGLGALLTKPGSASGWSGPYVVDIPTDPWNRPYIYTSPGANGGVDIISHGESGAPGTDTLNNHVKR